MPKFTANSRPIPFDELLTEISNLVELAEKASETDAGMVANNKAYQAMLTKFGKLLVGAKRYSRNFVRDVRVQRRLDRNNRQNQITVQLNEQGVLVEDDPEETMDQSDPGDETDAVVGMAVDAE